MFVHILSKRPKGAEPLGIEGRHDFQTRLQNAGGEATSQVYDTSGRRGKRSRIMARMRVLFPVPAVVIRRSPGDEFKGE